MPQFDLDNFVPQLAWLTIFFAILYFGIVKLTLPKLGRVMTAREDKVSGDLSTAEAAKAEADRIDEAYAAGIADAQGRARASLTEARVHATKAVEGRLAASAAELGAKNDAALGELAQARSKALKNIEAVAADAAADIVERLTGGRPDTDAASRAARAALAG